MGGGRGYLETAIGSLVGVVAGTAAGYFLGFVYAETFMPDAGLEAIFPLFIGIAAGIAIGIGVGTWGALRLRRHLAAGVTGLVSAFLGTVAALVVLWMVEVKLDAITGRNAGQWLAPGFAAGAAMLTAVGVRYVVARFRRADWGESLQPK